MTKIIKRYKFWVLLLFLFISQAVYTINSMGQIRYEELAESARNPFWFQNRLMYDGLSGSMAWYGFQALVYNIFGFHLFAAKVIRLILAGISIFCLAGILKKYLGIRNGLIPLLAIGISPTLLYFNILQTTYGMDLQFLPICLYLLSRIYQNPQKTLNHILLWMLVMIAWLCYPNLVFYIPALGIIYYFILRGSKIQSKSKKVLFSIIAFLSPLLIVFFYIKNRQDLIYDPIAKSGLFRGGVKSGIDFSSLWPSLQVTLGDLFQRGNSYYFELKNTEFSGYYPIIAVLLVMAASFYIFFTLKKIRLILGVIYLTVLLTIFLGHSTGDSEFSGIRRATPLLASFYILYSIVWLFIFKLKIKLKFLKFSLICLLLLLPLHHLLVYPENLSFLKRPSPYRDQGWFGVGSSPEKSLEILIDRVQKDDLKLICADNKSQCRYQEVYAAVAGSCLWNRLECHRILGYDERIKKMIPLSIELLDPD